MSYTNDYNQGVDWVESIRQGQFHEAERQITDKALARVDQAYTAMKAGEQCEAILDQVGDLAPLVRDRAAQRLQSEVAQGRVQNAHDAVSVFRDAVQDEVRELNASGVKAAPDGFRDYIAQRRQMSRGTPRDVQQG
jgi:hypothetical protein